MELHFAKTLRIAGLAIVMTAALLVAGCAGSRKEAPPPSAVADGGGGTSAVELYDIGAAHLLAGKLDEAEQSFRASLALARKSGLDFAPPHEGLARIDLKRNKIRDAEGEAARALALDKYWLPVYWVLGQIEELRNKPDAALVQYQHGLTISPKDAELVAATVALLRKRGRTAEADALLAESQVTVSKPPTRSPGPPEGEGAPGDSANGGAAGPGASGSIAPGGAHAGLTPAAADSGRLESDQAVRARLAPFFPSNQKLLSPAVLAVFEQPYFTRGALAILLTGDGEHALAEALNRMGGIQDGSISPPPDTQGRPEAPWIHRALAMGLIEAFPDGTFRPDQPMTRIALALWIEDTIAQLRNDQHVFQLYRGRKSPFTDVPDGYYGLNAAQIAVDLGLLKLDNPGRFEPDRKVRMEEGIEAVQRLAPALLGEKR